MSALLQDAVGIAHGFGVDELDFPEFSVIGGELVDAPVFKRRTRERHHREPDVHGVFRVRDHAAGARRADGGKPFDRVDLKRTPVDLKGKAFFPDILKDRLAARSGDGLDELRHRRRGDEQVRRADGIARLFPDGVDEAVDVIEDHFRRG